jgi:hypothetical protein
MALNYIYCATGLTGGSTGDLDTLVAANLVDKDMAFAIDQTTVYVYALDADSGLAESSPDVIKPDDETGNKRWILQSMRVNDLTVSDDIILVTDDLNVGGDLAVTGAITGNTIDATTDFTVGGTVITTGVITDNGALLLNPTGNLDIQHTNVNSATVLRIGQDKAQRGTIYLYGDTTGEDDGGQLWLFSALDYEGSVDNYQIQSFQDDLYIGPGSDTDSLKYDGGTGQWVFTGAAGADVINALSADTVDADTDFTVGGTVITDNTITDDGTLDLVATTAVDVTGGVFNVGVSDSVAGDITIFGGAVGTGTGGTLGIEAAPVVNQEDLTTYTETDPGGDFTVIADRVTFDTLPGNVTSYVYKDFGAAYFGDFSIDFEVVITNSSGDGANCSICKFANSINTNDGHGASKDALGLTIHRGASNLQFQLQDYEGAQPVDIYLHSSGTIPQTYITFSRVGSTATALLYSDAERTTLIDTLTITCNTSTYRYFYVISSRGSDTDTLTGVVEDYQIDGEAATSVDYNLIVDNTGLNVGSDSDADMLLFTGSASISATVPLIGTTIDASTDFTVGGTVITDADITDDGTLNIDGAVGGITVQHAGTTVLNTTATG